MGRRAERFFVGIGLAGILSLPVIDLCTGPEKPKELQELVELQKGLDRGDKKAVQRYCELRADGSVTKKITDYDIAENRQQNYLTGACLAAIACLGLGAREQRSNKVQKYSKS